jgi:hypothetical protein
MEGDALADVKMGFTRAECPSRNREKQPDRRGGGTANCEEGTGSRGGPAYENARCSFSVMNSVLAIASRSWIARGTGLWEREVFPFRDEVGTRDRE